MPKGSQDTAIPRNVATAIVIKDRDVFFLADHGGGIPAGNQDGFGLYYHDCRYLDGYTIRIGGTAPNALLSTSERGSIAAFELTNEKLQLDTRTVPEQTIGIRLQRVIDSGECAVHDVFTVENYGVDRQEIPISFTFESKFEDVFEIRGLHPKKVGRAQPPSWRDGVLALTYDGADGVSRCLEVHPEPEPAKTDPSGAEFLIALSAGERVRITLSLRIIETREPKRALHRHATDPCGVVDQLERRSAQWLDEGASISTNGPHLQALLQRSLLDLHVLRSSLDGLEYFSAGLPWYGTLFGRDSLIAALETLAYEPHIAEQTLRLLAKYQGREQNEWRDEQPGKILHELRRGELANLNEIPQTPYYGSVDSTPLFLILVGELAAWTGDLQLFRDLRDHVDRALHWIDSFGDEAQNGYLSYQSKSRNGLGNQGWKDSGDSVMNADGSLAEPPIALVEVQGYVYRAKRLIADLYARSGEVQDAARLRREADDLARRFNREFWVDDEQFYAIALQRGNRPSAVISSNPGQALWTGIVDQARVGAVASHLTAADMYSGWGIRTLSTKERRANPIGYHLGTVWPHDNAIVAAGLRRYGFDREAAHVLEGLVQAARFFERYRLPEVFAGFSRQQFAEPVRYPVACHPQAWAAGSAPFLLTTLLGLSPNAFEHRLDVIRPVLPLGVDHLEFRRIRIGAGSVSLRFRRKRDDRVDVEVFDDRGVDVHVERESPLVAH